VLRVPRSHCSTPWSTGDSHRAEPRVRRVTLAAVSTTRLRVVLTQPIGAAKTGLTEFQLY
jgi:hypothetical protein